MRQDVYLGLPLFGEARPQKLSFFLEEGFLVQINDQMSSGPYEFALKPSGIWISV